MKKPQPAYRKRRNRDTPVPHHVHGTINGYSNWQCRCDLCREVNRIASHESRLRGLERMVNLSEPSSQSS